MDNLIKLMSIQQRLKYGLPVILMGETGCGKTALVKFLAETLDFKLFTLDIHGGITDASWWGLGVTVGSEIHHGMQICRLSGDLEGWDDTLRACPGQHRVLP